MNGIIRYAIACDRLLSFRIIFLDLGFFFFFETSMAYWMGVG